MSSLTSINEKPVRRVLILGGAGYIGAVLTRRLLESGYETTVFDRLLFGPAPLAALEGQPEFHLIIGDMRDTAAVSAAVRNQDAVILLAALVGEPACNRDPKETLDVNYLGSLVAIEAALRSGVSRFLFSSTDSCYGIQEGILTEDSPLMPISLYSELKRDLELKLLALADPNFHPTILRLATVYGLSPRMRFDLIINILTLHAVIRGRINIFGGRQWRPLVHVADVARGFLAALATPSSTVHGQVFNIGSNTQNYQIGTLGRLVADVLPGTIVDTTDHPPDLRDYHVNFDRATRILGFNVQYSVADGIREIATALESGALPDPEAARYRNA